MSVLAHQGGWDEVLFVVAPIAIFGVLLVIANRRANMLQREREVSDETDRPESQ